MREITRVEEYYLQGMKAVNKVRTIIKSGKAKEILVEDVWGEVKFRIHPDTGFLNQELKMLRGIMKVIKDCKLVVRNQQPQLLM